MESSTTVFEELYGNVLRFIKNSKNFNDPT